MSGDVRLNGRGGFVEFSIEGVKVKADEVDVSNRGRFDIISLESVLIVTELWEEYIDSGLFLSDRRVSYDENDRMTSEISPS